MCKYLLMSFKFKLDVSSDQLTLSATYDYKSNVTITDELVNARKRSVNISSIAL